MTWCAMTCGVGDTVGRDGAQHDNPKQRVGDTTGVLDGCHKLFILQATTLQASMGHGLTRHTHVCVERFQDFLTFPRYI